MNGYTFSESNSHSANRKFIPLILYILHYFLAMLFIKTEVSLGYFLSYVDHMGMLYLIPAARQNNFIVGVGMFKFNELVAQMLITSQSTKRQLLFLRCYISFSCCQRNATNIKFKVLICSRVISLENTE